MKKALGKGLSALIPDSYVKIEKNTQTVEGVPGKEPARQAADNANAQGFQMIPLDQIQPNHDQPRQEFDPESIEELAVSIKEKGVLQPIVLKQMGERRYEVVCGERRLRASRLCGLTSIPAVIKNIADEEFLEWALIENVQREDLNPIEEAEAYQRLIEERKLSQDEVADRVGKNRVTVTNALRLLRLPQDIRTMIVNGRLTQGHARALLPMLSPEHQRQLAKRIIQDNLSVRQVEAIVQRSNAHRRKPKKARHLSPEITDLEHRISQHLGTQVKIFPRKNMKEGRLEMHYYSLNDLDRILEKIGLPAE